MIFFVQVQAYRRDDQEEEGICPVMSTRRRSTSVSSCPSMSTSDSSCQSFVNQCVNLC